MEIIQRLEATRNSTLRYFELPEAELNRSRGPGKWSIRWILHHLADTETVLYDRIRRVIAEPRGVIWAFDQEAWAGALDYEHLPLETSRGIYSAVREGVIYQARLHYEKSGQREFVHSEAGVRTLRDEFDKVAWHNEQHLRQIAETLGG